MRAVVQRVKSAAVSVGGEKIAAIGPGLCVLVAVSARDTDRDASRLAAKLAGLRIFEDEQGRIAHSLLEIGAEVLLVSQFTLYADCRKGRRPSFSGVAPAERGRQLYQELASRLRCLGVKVHTGIFQARMQVELINDGPFTILLDTERAG